MKLEHIGLIVDHPISMAEWWIENLGFECLRKSGTDEYGVAFLCDHSGSVVELAKLKELKGLDLRQLELIQLHFAIECSDPLQEAERLVGKGATFIGESPHNDYPNEKVILQDPWGAWIQLIRRKDKLPEVSP
jgi:hypothetical protein